MSPSLIELCHASKSFREGLSRHSNVILSDCSLSIYEAETVGLMGQSGSGKSTLGRILAGLEYPDAGSIRYLGKDISTENRTGWQEYRRSVQMLLQDPGGVFHPHRTVGQSLEMVATLVGYTSSECQNMIHSLCLKVGLHHEILPRYPDQISGGQAQRLALARILLVKPRLIILDEPTSGLDISVQAQILHLLIDIQKQERISYLLISHDPEVIRFMADRWYTLDKGALKQV